VPTPLRSAAGWNNVEKSHAGVRVVIELRALGALALSRDHEGDSVPRLLRARREDVEPECTMGFVRPPGPRSTAARELNAKRVAFTPIRFLNYADPGTAQTSAKTNGFATLMIVNSTSASPTS
jgi:hypothetical protein